MLIQEEVKEIYVWEDVEEWQPWDNTVAYWQFTSDTELTDGSWNWYTLSYGSTPSFWVNAWVDCIKPASSSWYLYRNTMAWMPKWASERTISLWVYTVSSWSNAIYLFSYWSWSSSAGNAQISINMYNLTLRAFYSSSWYLSKWWMELGKWYNIVITYDWTTYKLYVNWVMSDSIWVALNTTAVSSSYQMRLFYTSSAWYWSDTIIESVAWSDSDVVEYYNQTKSKYWL